MQKKIVIIDDDEGIRDIVKIIFEKAGYEVVILMDPALLYAHQHCDASIILLDKQLAGFDGIELCKYLKKQPQFKNIPVVLMSATNNICNLWQAAGADGFIEKPFSKKDLLQKIDHSLNRQYA